MITKVRLERKKRGWKTADLAQKSGIPAPVISKLENGYERLYPTYRTKLAAAFEISEEEAQALLEPVDPDMELLLR